MRMRHSPNDRRGMATVELALLVPLLVLFFVLAVDYARIFYFSITVTNCARNGAVYAAGTPAQAKDTDGIKAAAQADASNLDASSLTISSTTEISGTTTYVNVTVSYPFTTLTHYPGVPTKTTLSRTVKMAVAPMVPDGK